MKKVPKWAVIAALGGVAYLLFRNSAQIRQDIYGVSRTVSERTGGRIPTLPSSVLPNVTPDPGFGVGIDLPSWLTNPYVPGVATNGSNLNTSGSSGFSVGLR